MKEKKKFNNSHQDKSEKFGAEIESKTIDLDGPELLQFAMILVQGALNKSQVCDLYKSLLELSFLVLSGRAYNIDKEKVMITAMIAKMS